jgi:amino-acid N-acetyltransferase
MPDVLALLSRAGLPQEGLMDHLGTTLVVRSDRQTIGSAALEMYGRAALLRSVAVEASWRGRRVGERLVRSVLDLARESGIEVVYLLTETAAPFFARLGFRTIRRSAVRPEVQQSLEFTTLCPDSAQAMVLELV